jgi:hypothetical protein
LLIYSAAQKAGAAIASDPEKQSQFSLRELGANVLSEGQLATDRPGGGAKRQTHSGRAKEGVR